MLQGVSDFADVDARVRDLPAHGRGVGPAAVVLARAGARRRATAASSSCSTAANADGVADDRRRSRRAPVGLMLGLECTLHPLLTEPRVPRDRARCRSPSACAMHGRSAVQGAGARGRRARSATTRRPAAASSRRSTGCSSSAIRPTTSPTRRRASRARARREGRDALDLAYDLLLRDGGRVVPLPAVPQLRRRQPRRGRRDARAPEHRRRPRRRRRAPRHDLRRELPHDAAHALGARPRPRPARPPVRGAAPHAARPRAPSACSTGACSRPATGPT